MPDPVADQLAGLNLSVLIGTLNRSPELRALPSGDHLLALDLTVHPAGEPRESVPVAWPGAPASAAAWRVGEELLVVGRVRRRFFRAGGITQSRTEVVATTAIPVRRSATVRKAVRAAIAGVERRL
ncbi:MAG: hypothetical protein WD691_00550 [Acidimicrobiales bacterium]